MERYRHRTIKGLNRAKSAKEEYFYPMKALRRLLATITVALLAFRAVGTFLSWVEKQDDHATDAWVDEDEFEDA